MVSLICNYINYCMYLNIGIIVCTLLIENPARVHNSEESVELVHAVSKIIV